MKANRFTCGPGRKIVACRDGAAGEGGGFTLAPDGWIMVLPKGTFPGVLRSYDDAGDEVRRDIVQQFDDQAFAAITDEWNARKAAMGDNFPGMLIDYDHFSHDEDKPTGAAGWIEDLQVRDDGLWGMPRWSVDGKAKLEGGIYRLVSPVLGKFEKLGVQGEGDQQLDVMRPGCLVRLALTNDPQLRGMPPVANRDTNRNPTGNQAMDYKTFLLQLLGLPLTATDEEISAAASTAIGAMNAACATEPKKSIEQMRARLVSVSNELVQARAQADELGKELIAHDVARFKGLVPDEAKLREMLTANRTATVATLTAVEAKASAGGAGGAGGSGRTPMHDSRNRTHPGSPDSDGTEMTEADAAKIRMRAEAIRAESGWAWNRCFDEATREFRTARKAGISR